MDCFTVIVGKSASATGNVLVAHNEDDYLFVSLRHGYVPRTKWAEGVMLPAEQDCTPIPQINETYGYYWTQVRTPNGGLATGDAFFNENGVCVVSDSSCGSHQDADEETHLPGICYELRRAIAERASSARHGLQIAIELVEEYGYNSPGRIYTIADANEAFMIQIVRGHRYIAARVPDDAVVIMPNHYTFHTLTDVPEMFYPDDIAAHAYEMGWLKEGEEFDFAKAYQDPKTYQIPVNTLRQDFATPMLTGTNPGGYPFCVKATRKISVKDLTKVLSTHYEGSEQDVRSGNGQSPHFTDVRRICVGSTVEATVYELNEEPARSTLWTAFGRPCELPFIPLHPLAGIAPSLNSLPAPLYAAEHHHDVLPRDVQYRKNDIWQQFTDFENQLDALYCREIAGVTALKEQLFEQMEQNPVSDEQQLRYALEELQTYAREHFNTIPLQIDAACADSKGFTVSFETELPIKADSVVLYGRYNIFHAGLSGELQQDGSVYTARFEFEEPPFKAAGTGEYELFISALTTEDVPICGSSLIKVEADSE